MDKEKHSRGPKRRAAISGGQSEKTGGTRKSGRWNGEGGKPSPRMGGWKPRADGPRKESHGGGKAPFASRWNRPGSRQGSDSRDGEARWNERNEESRSRWDRRNPDRRDAALREREGRYEVPGTQDAGDAVQGQDAAFRDGGPADGGEGVLAGRRAVAEALRAGVPLDKVYLQKGESGLLRRLASQARAAGAVVVEVDRRKLDTMSAAHQGIVALAAAQRYATVEEMFALARERGEAPLLVVCDEISDPHNLGAVLRSAECAGAHGVIIPKRRSAGLTAVVSKTSAGAAAHMLTARVPNIPALLKDLKKQGVWVCGAAAGGDTLLYDADLTGPTALVIGSEGDGMTRLAEERCDLLLRIPLRGKLDSLNASAAAAVLLYEAVRQRTRGNS